MNKTMKNTMITLFLLSVICTANAQPYGEMIGDNIAVFYPAGFNPGETLPSLSLLEEPVAIGPVPDDWLVTPEFYVEAGKNCARIHLEDGTDLYGTGEVVGPLRRNQTEVILWNTDNYAYVVDNGKRLYQSHPWIMALRGDGSAYGILVDHTWKQAFHLDNPVRVISEGPPFRIIVIERGSPQELLTALSGLTGTSPLPPLWSLGYHQCRYSYYPASQVMEIADKFREKQLPCDVIWMDIDYMNGYRVFTFDPEGFPDPAGLNDYLHERAFSSIWMIDPGVKKDNSYWVYNQGFGGNHWVLNAANSPYFGDVWPGSCAFPDFTRPETRAWWAGLYPPFMATGIDGIWNDMNEPAVFNTGTMTMPEDNIHRGGGGLPQDVHLRYHNVYGMLMVMATREGMELAQPDKRPFVLTRANFLGGQRYAATWTGDNISSWEHLKMSIPMSINLGLSGQPHSGPDVGGYVGSPGADLLGHWMALGPFYPFFRNHSGKGTAWQEPWAYGPEIESVSRRALERRYRLLPYIYTLCFASSQQGNPLMLPLFFSDASDLSLRREEQAFLFGNDLMVVPQWAAYPNFPADNWRRIRLLEGTAEEDGYQPELRQRPGSIIPLGPIIQSTAWYSADSITLLIAPDAEYYATGSFYHDAGNGYGYREGEYVITDFQASPHGNDSLRVTCLGSAGNWNAGGRAYRAGVVTGYGTHYSAWINDSVFLLPRYPDLYVHISNLSNGDQFDPGGEVLVQAIISGDFIPGRLDFYANEQLIGTDPVPPYEITWQVVPSGKYAIRAVAHLDGELRVESLPVNIRVGNFGEGSILRQVWYDIEGLEVYHLTGHPDFPDHPDETGYLSSFSSPRNVAENYGSRIIGYVHPPVSEHYTFSISGDDFCELWLSQDSLASGLQKIAEVPGWTQVGEWDKYPAQRSAPVWLTGGRKYMIMALHKEGGNDDHVDVAWEFPGNSQEIITGEYLSPFDLSSDVPSGPGLENRLTIYPNPAKRNVMISSAMKMKEISLISITGTEVKRFIAGDDCHTENMDISDLSSGIYLIQINRGNDVVHRKLIIQREQ